MRILIACEYSGIVRDAFSGVHEVMSCDLLPSETTGIHHIGNVLDILEQTTPWDLMIAHPPCTRLCSSGARWKYEKEGWAEEQDQAAEFFMALANAPIKRICIENPVGIMSTRWRKPDQYIQPWEYGHGETKKTGLWLKGLPKLKPTDVVTGRESRIHSMGPSPDRGKERSRFYTGIAAAMANQWGRL